jgi:hypothetical protein
VKRRALLLGIVLTLVGTLGAAHASAALYDVKATWGPTVLEPGEEGQFQIQARNIGAEDSKAQLTIVDQLPAGVKAKAVAVPSGPFPADDLQIAVAPSPCAIEGPQGETVKCVFADELLFNRGLARAPGTQAQFFGGSGPTGYFPTIYVDVEVDPGAAGTATNTVTLEGGGAAEPVSDTDQVGFGATPAGFGIVAGSYFADVFDAAYPFGSLVRQAGAHPFEQRVRFDLNERSFLGTDGTRENASEGAIKTAEVTLPRGFIGNPEATPRCDPADFAQRGVTIDSTACPANTQVGYLNVPATLGDRSHGEANFKIASSILAHVPIYNLEPPKGVPADLAFNAGTFVVAHIYPELDPAQNYAIKTVTPNISNLVNVRGGDVTIWGVPGDPAHDKFRYYPELHEDEDAAGAPFTAPIRPFLSNPIDCGFDNGGSLIHLESYQHQGEFTPAQEYPDPDNVTGCEDPRFRFEPDISVQPTAREAGASIGLAVHLEVPQRDDEVTDATDLYAQNGKVKAIPTPPMKKAVVTLPEGMTVNPAAAQGLASCTPQQIELGSDAPVTCPDASQFGTLTLHTPILPVDEQPEGFVYVASQNDNYFHNFLTLYLVIQEPERGILVKVPGRVDLDPVTGQITTSFDDLPQFPLEDMELHVKGGLRAGLVNPQTCGTKTIKATFYSWQDPQTPHSVTSSYEVTQNPDGSACHDSLSERPFDPLLSGGTVNNRAGSYSPLEIQMTRSDEDQELLGVEGTAPPGLLASLKGVGRCSDAAIAAAADPGRTGTEEVDSPSCPATSLVGTLDAGAGVGQVLTYVKGKVYLAGPYKGAPLSGVAIVPAVAGPFDLGVIVTRAPAYVDARTAQLSLKTDPLPLIFKGVPVRVRDIRVHLDRSRFTLNPTSCDPFGLVGTLFSSEGKSKLGGSRFQAADCGSLGFRPHLATQLFGGARRGAHPRFKGTLEAREGDANVASAVVSLPRSEFLDQAHIRTVCTRVQFAAAGGHGAGCPAASIYGHAEARTPLLDETLSGPVYLRSSDHKLPDLVVVLHGIVEVQVSARIDSIRGGIRASFEEVPDAPVEEFVIAMQGGRKGLLINSRDVCAQRYRVDAQLEGQNGRRASLGPKLRAHCKAKRKRKRHG